MKNPHEAEVEKVALKHTRMRAWMVSICLNSLNNKWFKLTRFV